MQENMQLDTQAKAQKAAAEEKVSDAKHEGLSYLVALANTMVPSLQNALVFVAQHVDGTHQAMCIQAILTL